MSANWAGVDAAWLRFTGHLSKALSMIEHGDVLFLYPEPAEPTRLPLSGPSIRIFRWGDGPPVAIGRPARKIAAADARLLRELGWRNVSGDRARRRHLGEHAQGDVGRRRVRREPAAAT